MEFKDPPQPENITVIPVYNPKTDANYSMNVKQEECLFWDSVKEQWLSRGCKVSSLVLVMDGLDWIGFRFLHTAHSTCSLLAVYNSFSGMRSDVSL